MLTLVLLRHAKSSWDDPAEDDFGRPLNARGKKSAPEAGRMLKELHIKPDRILCSPAARTRETLGLALTAAGPEGQPDIAFEDRLYLATAPELLDCLGDVDAAHKCVVLVGHNPGLQALAVSLAGSGEEEALERLSDKFPTAGMAVLNFNCQDWRDVAPGRGRLKAFWTPREGLSVRD